MRELLLEGVKGAFPFIVDRSKQIVSESLPAGTVTRIPGRFSICDCINGNNRRYSKRVWEANLKPGSVLQKLISENAAFGLLEHPKDGIVTLESPISHHVTKAVLTEGKDESGNTVFEVVGEISLYNTPEGLRLQEYIKQGYNPLVSSRGYGSLNRATDGVDDVLEDYVCEGWDVVRIPSFATAILTPVRESEDTNKLTMCPDCGNHRIGKVRRCECGFTYTDKDLYPDRKKDTGPKQDKDGDVSVTETKQALRENVPSTGVVSTHASKQQTGTNIMESKDIKILIENLRSLDTSKIDPSRFAESLQQIENTHSLVAEFAAADPKRSWEAQKMHRDLDSIATKITESVQEPAKQAKRLSENATKLMKVVNAVAQTAVSYKKQLGESVKKVTQAQKVHESIVKRGQGWKSLAEKREARVAELQKKFDVATEALDKMAARYHQDTTTLGKRLLRVEFKEQTSDPLMLKRIKEATRVKQLVSIREEIEGKKPKDGDKAKLAKEEEKGEKGEVIAKSPGKVTNEAKAEVKTEAKAASTTEVKTPVQESKPAMVAAPQSQIFEKNRDPRDMNENIDMIKRLSSVQG